MNRISVRAASIAVAVTLSAAAVVFGQNAAKQRAETVAAELAQEIRGMLTAALAKGGFPAAVDACSVDGQKKTKEFSRRKGISIRRVSAKWRNPNDRPDAFETAELARWSQEMREGRAAQPHWAVRTEGGVKVGRYLQPVLVQPMCLQCHGNRESIPDDVRKVLDQRYPDDHAIGYKAGDLRGAISVTLPLEP